jgi:hypothetical protein
MVVIHCKRLPREEYSKDYDEFLASFSKDALVADVTAQVTAIQNMRVRMKWIIEAVKGLVNHLPDEQKHLLQGPLDEAQRYMALERCTEGKQESSLHDLNRLVENFKGAVMIVFPQHCSGTNVVAQLTQKMEAEHTDDATKALCHRLLAVLDDGAKTEDILVGSTTMWWSGKQLMKEDVLSKYTGKNDKTKIVVKLTQDGASAPPREPGLDAKTQSEMMAYWFRKQEEQKKLVEDDDISFGNSDWADPQGLKKQFLGMDQIKFKPR